MSIDPKFIDELLKQYRTPEDILGRDGLIKQLTKAVLERALDAELGHHLRQEPAAGFAHAEERPMERLRALLGRVAATSATVTRARR